MQNTFALWRVPVCRGPVKTLSPRTLSVLNTARRRLEDLLLEKTRDTLVGEGYSAHSGCQKCECCKPCAQTGIHTVSIPNLIGSAMHLSSKTSWAVPPLQLRDQERVGWKTIPRSTMEVDDVGWLKLPSYELWDSIGLPPASMVNISQNRLASWTFPNILKRTSSTWARGEVSKGKCL